jgi:alpha-D-xyloside xylohydrolase
MGIELMVSVWPTMQKDNEHYSRALQAGYLIQQHRGLRTLMDFRAECGLVDFTNPAARSFVWSLCKKNYYDHGIKLFWLDEAEPEYSIYHFDNYRYWSGNLLRTGNAYPRDFLRTFYEGLQKAGQENIINLVRCAWAGSQKYGALVWSGDIHSSFKGFRDQLSAGLNMGIAGISTPFVNPGRSTDKLHRYSLVDNRYW